MRQPSTSDERWDWWERAVAGEVVPVHEREPHAGFFKVRRFPYGQWRDGPYVPARTWWEPSEIDPETGELIADERLRGEIDGREVDPWDNWIWISRRPITEEEFRWLKALSPLLPTKIPSRG